MDPLKTDNVGNPDPPLSEIEGIDFSKLDDRPRSLNIERQWSCDDKALYELSGASCSLCKTFKNLENMRILEYQDHLFSPGGISSANTPKIFNGVESHAYMAEGWEALRRSLVYFRRQLVGTIVALDHTEEALNYNQVFVRDFFPSALAFLMKGELEIVKNFLLKTLRLQSWEKKIDRFKLGEGAMPTSFKVLHDPVRNNKTLKADFGESAIGRVAPIDSDFWWIILLRAYAKPTGDSSLSKMPECQKGMRL